MGVQFNPISKYILITAPTTNISALEIYCAAMDWCDDQATISYTVPMAADGKFDMGGGAYSDPIFRLINGWKIKFWSGDYQATITGTLLGEPGESRTVPPDSGNVEVTFQVSSQGILADPAFSDEELIAIATKVWLEDAMGDKMDEILELSKKTQFVL